MRATIHYTIPAPEDNAIGGAAIAEVALNRLGYEFGKAHSSIHISKMILPTVHLAHPTKLPPSSGSGLW